MTATLESPNGVAKGYLPAARPRYRWVTCEWTERPDDPDAEPFRADIRTNLTFAEIDELADPSLTYQQLWRAMAPHVRAWNALGRDAETGEIVAVPAPAEAGPEAFRAIEADLSLWLRQELQTLQFGGEEREKKSPPPAKPDATKRGGKRG